MNGDRWAIADPLNAHGWFVERREEVGAWWEGEVWRLRSRWTPRECALWLIFLIDPQSARIGASPGARSGPTVV